MTTLLLSHADCLGHETSRGHPESADRLRAVLGALEGEDFTGLVRRDAPLASEEQILRVHPAAHLAAVKAASASAAEDEGRVHLDPDTTASAGSHNAALRAAGAVCAGVDAVMEGAFANAFCAVRPPGHHAEPARAMGFCLLNNVAIGAAHARAVHGVERVAVVDFDVHHGNGTQAAFESDETLFYASTHQMPLYPGTGEASETGVGNILNLPLHEGCGSSDLRHAVEAEIVPALRAFAPDLLIISAGFDGHRGDPLAGLNFETEDYYWITAILLDVADEICDGRVVSALEGGYNLVDLAASAAEHVRALMVRAQNGA